MRTNGSYLATVCYDCVEFVGLESRRRQLHQVSDLLLAKLLLAAALGHLPVHKLHHLGSVGRSNGRCILTRRRGTLFLSLNE
jgi:hypothetical protein